jgi:methylmalonyl-CoA/ethylmalonyl-CoA epimerase
LVRRPGGLAPCYLPVVSARPSDARAAGEPLLLSPEPIVSDAPRIAHVGIAVTELEPALAFYRDVLGLEPHPPEVADGATIVSIPFGESDVELLVPLTPDGPVARFLERRGPGIHHICYRVPDLDAAIGACRDAGYRLVDEIPRRGAGGRRIAFIHPKATGGILLELTE